MYKRQVPDRGGDILKPSKHNSFLKVPVFFIRLEFTIHSGLFLILTLGRSVSRFSLYRVLSDVPLLLLVPNEH